MTGLRSFSPETKAVEFPGGEFSVRGLSPEDVALVLRNHYEVASELFDRYLGELALSQVGDEATGGAIDLGDTKRVLADALAKAPAMLAEVIARAADEPEEAERARLLPLRVQIDALGKIIGLTLKAEGGLEKLMETVQQAVADLAPVVSNPSP